MQVFWNEMAMDPVIFFTWSEFPDKDSSSLLHLHLCSEESETIKSEGADMFTHIILSM